MKHNIVLILLVVLFVRCSNNNDFEEIEIITYDWSFYSFSPHENFSIDTIKLKPIEYALIDKKGNCYAFAYRCHYRCYEQTKIKKSKLSEFIKASKFIGHDTLMDAGRDGQPFLKYIIHYKNKDQIISVVRDHLKPNVFISFLNYINDNLAKQSFDPLKLKFLTTRRNQLMKSMSSNEYKDPVIYDLIKDFKVYFLIDTISR